MFRLIFYYWIKLERLGKLYMDEGPFCIIAGLFVKTHCQFCLIANPEKVCVNGPFLKRASVDGPFFGYW